MVMGQRGKARGLRHAGNAVVEIVESRSPNEVDAGCLSAAGSLALAFVETENALVGKY